ncbi:tripartite tricarboxylate transporter substrate binding protein [Bordetella genomosp. 13]|nr:tripartite tricarboxylate transporter substrate binding protein [Bordetella genomosp. 13]
MVKWRLLCAALGLAATCGQPVWAAWPDDQPIEVLVGFAAGGTTDIMARSLAPYIEKQLGGKARLVIVNKPGASGELAVHQMQRAKPDGYTLAIVNLPGYFFLPMMRQTSYDPGRVALVARVVSDPTVLVTRANKGPQTMKQVMDQLASKPRSLSAGHNGIGTNGHLAMQRMQTAGKVALNDIPFKGTSEQKTSLGGGHIDLAFVSASEVQQAQAEGLKMLAQFRRDRLPSLPDVPTTFESGLPAEMTAERGFAMPKDVPADVAQRLSKAIENAMADPGYRAVARFDAPFLSYLDGPAWERRVEDERKAYAPLARELKEKESSR